MVSRHLQYRLQGSPGRTAGAALRHLLCFIAMSFFLAAGTPPPLKNAASSMDDLGKRVLEAVAKNDSKALDALRIDEQEYRAYIWPELPISRIPQWQKRYDYVWKDVNTKSRYGLQEVLARYAGQTFSFKRIKYKRIMEEYRNCTVYKDAIIVAQDRSGAEKELKLFGSIIKLGGRFKIVSYNLH